MAFVQRLAVTATTNGSGAATVYTEVATGFIHDVQYIKTDFTDGVDFTITTETTARNVWVDTNVNASEVVAPRQPTHNTAGAASLYAAVGEPVEDKIAIDKERIKIVIASGGDTKTGTFYVTIV